MFVDIESQVEDIVPIEVIWDSKGSTSIKQRADTTGNEFFSMGRSIRLKIRFLQSMGQV